MVQEGPDIIGARVDIEELCRMVLVHLDALHGLVGAIQQLHHDIAVLNAAELQEDGGVFIHVLCLDASLELMRHQAIDVRKGCRVHLKAVFRPWMPVGNDFVLSQLRGHWSEFEGRPIPEAVNLGIEMDSRCVHTLQGRRHLDEDATVGVYSGRNGVGRLQGLDRIDAVVRLLALFLLLLLFLPVFEGFLLFLQTLLIRRLGQSLDGVGLHDEMSQGVCHHVVHLKPERVLIDKQRVAKPVGQRVFLGIALNEESPVGIEVHASDDGQ